MSLDIQRERGESSIPYTTSWHVGENNPLKWDEFESVIDIQIDGHELEHVKLLFNSPPFIPNGRIVRIFGDLAKTIVANLDNKF